MGSLPIIENISGKTVISKTAPGVSEIIVNGQAIDTISYGVNEAMLPTMEIRGRNARSMTWNPVTQKVARIGDWNYFPEFPERDPNHNFTSWSLDRKNDAGRLEKLSYKSNGGVTVRVFGGREETLKVFTTGLLKGKIREELVKESGKIILNTFYRYDDKARLIRKEEKMESTNSSAIYRYDESTGQLSETLISITGATTRYTFGKNGAADFSSSD